MSPGAYVVTVKPIESLLKAVTEFDSVRASGLVVRVVGGGTAAVEVALALAFRWRGLKNRRVSIVTATTLLEEFPGRVRALALAACRKDGVEVLEKSLVQAWNDMQRLGGTDASTWQWGKLHQSFFGHALANAADEASRARLNVGPMPKQGGSDTVNVSSFDPNNFRQVGGPSFRMVLDVGSWDNGRGESRAAHD